MEASIATTEAVTAYIGIDWADQKHAIALRSAAEPNKIEHQLIDQKPEALMEWIGRLEHRFGAQGKILVCLEQSRGALIYHLMGYEFFELYPANSDVSSSKVGWRAVCPQRAVLASWNQGWPRLQSEKLFTSE